MPQSFEPVDTVLGIIKGRDAIFLDDAIFDYRDRRIEFRGEFNSDLCSKSLVADAFIGYSLRFAGILAITMVELDLSDFAGESSFDRVIDSDWVAEMRRKDHSSKVKGDLQHYIVATYDDVFNIACETFELEILNTNDASPSPF